MTIQHQGVSMSLQSRYQHGVDTTIEVMKHTANLSTKHIFSPPTLLCYHATQRQLIDQLLLSAKMKYHNYEISVVDVTYFVVPSVSIPFIQLCHFSVQ